jgi:phospholipase C
VPEYAGFKYNCKRFWGSDDAVPPASLASLLASRSRHKDTSGDLLPRVAVFDQFEELFTAYPARWKQREEFFTQLDEAMAADASLRVLFAMREDFIAQLDPYQGMLPEELRTRYRLEQLRKEAALAAVERPLEGTGIHFKPGVAELLVADLISVSSGETDHARVPGEFVDPVQLQVACFSLFRNLPPKTTEITDQHLTAFGDVDQALLEFYRAALQETASKTGVDEDGLRQWFEGKLITESGSRGLAFRADKTTGGIANTAVDVLEELHIIRPDVRGRDRWYELSHDRFIQPILRANDEWRARVKKMAEETARQEAAAEAAKQEREAAQKRELEQAQALAHEQMLRAQVIAVAARRFRRVSISLGAALVLAVTAAVWAYLAQQKARKSAAAAEQSSIEATKQSKLAKRNALAKDINALAAQTLLNATKDKVVKATGNATVPQPPPVYTPGGSRIEHVIVLMMENRSFDHMLGALKAVDARIDGLTGNEGNPDTTGSTAKVQSLANFQGQLVPDPDHYFQAVNLQVFGGDAIPGRAANMQGFVKSYFDQQPDVNHSHVIMFYFTPDKLPVLATLATEFAVCDHWFSSVPGPTFPNWAFAHYGTSFGQIGMDVINRRGPYRSIFQRLINGGRTAKIYYYDKTSAGIGVFGLMKLGPQMFGTFSDFLADTAAGNLPDYSFVEPSYTDHEGPDGAFIPASDQHPDHNVQQGEIFMATVYMAIHTNPDLWKSSVLVITYSNHGGIYDHVPPPKATPDGFVAPPDQTGTGMPFAFDRLGVRVPAVIVSPWIPRGTVDHTIYDHASIMRKIDDVFGSSK